MGKHKTKEKKKKTKKRRLPCKRGGATQGSRKVCLKEIKASKRISIEAATKRQEISEDFQPSLGKQSI